MKVGKVLLVLGILMWSCCKAEPYNPKPDPEDVVIGLPCEMNMVFRKVYTQYDHKQLVDTRYRAGTAKSVSPMAQAQHENYIQGSFEDEKGFYYLIGKYEVMTGQYQAVLADKCPVASGKSLQLPVTNISWFEATEFTRKLSLYLLSHPLQELQQAYVRLPTDSEWEFAARGGLAVSQSEFEANLPPLEGQLSDYAWYEGVKSANNHLNLPGLLMPNPLGLYDMLGNAQEMVFEPFRLTRTGRLHGQSGGYIVRGGGYLTPATQLSSAFRTEKSYYKGKQENRSKDTGFRVVLSDAVASDVKSVRELNAQVEALGTEDNTGKADGSEQLNTIAQLDALIKQTQDEADRLLKQAEQVKTVNEQLDLEKKELADRLTMVREQLVVANSERDGMRDVAVAANLRLGSFLCANLAATHKQLNFQLESAVTYGKRCLESKTYCTVYQNYKSNAEKSQEQLKALATYYGDNLAEGRSTYRMSLFASQFKQLTTRGHKAFEPYIPYLKLYYEHLQAYATDDKDAEQNFKRWQKQCYLIMEGEGS